MHAYDLCHGFDHDDWELGLRVACAMYAENANDLLMRHRMIMFRATGSHHAKP